MSKSQKLYSIFFCLIFLVFIVPINITFSQTCTDGDGDGYGQFGDTSCPNPGVDCNDTNNTVFPNAPILCDGLDNNCDGIQDFGTDVDVDEDGVPRCAGDCDDSDPLRYPGNAEFFGDPSCSDGIDNDCDNQIDIADPQCADNCTDNDGDGYGNPGHSSCTNGITADCNDNDINVNPGATDTDCNGVDDNCSGTADEGYVAPPTICGVGECASTGLDECQSGTIVNTCVPGAAQPECPFPGDPSNTDGLDNDCDGLIDECPVGSCWDVDGDGYGAFGDPSCPNGTLVDCDDDDPTIPRPEPDDDCNGIDEDCSGIPDDTYVPTPTICGEGVCSSTGQLECIGATEVDNCTPGTPTEDPEATCDDGLDNDCDGLTDKISGISDPDCDDSKIDNDNDGFCADPVACTDGSLPGDCDDTNNTVFPNAPILCDGLDNNCDGLPDFGTDRDVDEDGVPRCAGDCDDTDPLRYPGNPEFFGDPSCSDGIDNDCDNLIDIVDPQCADTCTDNDGDGYGNPGHSSCSNGSATDCNDNNAAINPGATDTDCNGVDDNCSGTADDGYIALPTICGVGECASTGLDECQSGTIVDTCTPGAPQPECPLPGDPSNTDGFDNDCDGLIDECPVGPCWDVDGDGYGVLGDPSCPNGTLVDCDDGDPTIPRPEPADDCNGLDEDCSGIPDDTYVPTPTICGEGVCSSTGQLECIGGTEVDNCTPGTPTEDPEATCDDGLDNDCDGLTDKISGIEDPDCDDSTIDNDGDGFCADPVTCTDGSLPGDCDDTNNTVFPNAPILCDGLDNNCDGSPDFGTDVDVDEDGVPRCAGDCDDTDPLRYPGNPEFFGDPSCSDGIDNDCDNLIDIVDPQCADTCTDNDGDGYGNPGHSSCSNGSATDCNDNNAAINPGATDTDCNGVDDNCSGTADDGYIAPPTICGVGECASTGLDECQSGTIVDTCTPGAPQPECPSPGDPSNTDGLDNDCDGLIDECPVGPCWDVDGDGYGVLGDPSCPNGTLVDCDDGDPTIPRPEPADDCNGLDEDCSGIPDDTYVPTATICGEGVCASTGQLECIGGTEQDNCTPGAPTENPEATCDDGLDNDCDGLTDKISGIEDPDCDDSTIDNDGDGFCADPVSCTDGSLPGDCDDTNNTVFPNAPILCDGLDNNCDGSPDFGTDVDVDEDGVARCAGDCDDNDPLRYPGNAEIYGDPSCSDGIDNDCSGVVDDCPLPSCDTKLTPRNGPHMFDLMDPGADPVDPADDTLVTSSCSWCHTDILLGTGSVDQKPDCQRCHADPTDTSDPLNGVLKDPVNPNAYPGDPPYGFGMASNVKLHSSTVLGTKYGSWDMDCLTCHNPHMQEQDVRYGTSYGKYIKEYICFDNPVTGLNIEEVVEFTSDTGQGSFADGAPYNENVCEMCHTQTKYHRNDGSTAVHNDGNKCTDCHLHSDGFLPVAKSPHNTSFFNDNCQLCHVETGGVTDLSATIPDANCQRCHGERTSHTGDLTRNKFASGNYVYDFLCVDCHDPMTTVGDNRKLLRETIAGSVIPGSIVSNTTRIGAGSLGDGPPRSENICETCHFLTSHNRGDGTGDGVHLDGINYDGSYCMLCHDHNRSFMVPGPGAEE